MCVYECIGICDMSCVCVYCSEFNDKQQPPTQKEPLSR